jgi:hypothetical protein
LLPANVFAVWLTDHLATWGQAIAPLVSWPETPGEKDLLLEKLTFIHRRRAQLEDELAARRKGS